MIHLLVHYLDDLRQQGASTFSWNAVKTNLGAAPYQFAIGGAIAAVVLPVVRAKAKAELEHIHAKLDHVIKHSADIPPFIKPK